MGKGLDNGSIEEKGRHLANKCPLCGKEKGNVDHLLPLCSKVQELWAMLFATFDINWILPCSVRDFDGGGKASVQEKILKRYQAPIAFFG